LHARGHVLEGLAPGAADLHLAQGADQLLAEGVHGPAFDDALEGGDEVEAGLHREGEQVEHEGQARSMLRWRRRTIALQPAHRAGCRAGRT
jgi:hypothetical protein